MVFAEPAGGHARLRDDATELREKRWDRSRRAPDHPRSETPSPHRVDDVEEAVALGIAMSDRTARASSSREGGGRSLWS